MEAMARRHDLSSLREDLRSAASLTEMILDSKDLELLLLKNDVQNKLGHLTSDDKKFIPPATASKVLFTYVLTLYTMGHINVPLYRLSNALHSSIGQNIKSHTVSGLRYPVSGVRSPARV